MANIGINRKKIMREIATTKTLPYDTTTRALGVGEQIPVVPEFAKMHPGVTDIGVSPAPAIGVTGMPPPVSVTAQAAPGLGVRRVEMPSATTPIPVGTGYIRNDVTGQIQKIQPTATAPAVAAAPAATPQTLEQRAQEYVDKVAANQPPEVRAQTFINYMRSVGRGEVRTAQSQAAQQKSAQEKLLLDVQREMTSPGVTPERLQRLQEVSASLTKRPLYKAMPAADDMGNLPQLYNVQTGQLMQPTSATGLSTPTVGMQSAEPDGSVVVTINGVKRTITTKNGIITAIR
jgi:hypothetical protein